ncbi:type II secretion system protein GspK [Thalassotalea marina]|uniref:T2SS protein K first SAM-like domain-containing protein n=1 Tax=Thalassotalea marina TaxID=1673741 RepID=A0A919BDI5_9GAMM|nr:type II secretion system protein GspK [Thalassotalea marina]GHF80863.1 hypothetical protein GCM10017161_05220 [Thalassotalea marina]
MKLYKLEKGIALIQVLVIVGILSTLALYLSTTARSQIHISQWASDRTDALIHLHSAESELLFNLLTKKKEKNFSEENLIVRDWNFHAEPFRIGDNVQVKMQDQSALINAHFPNIELMNKLLTFHGASPSEAQQIVSTLLDWQDLDNIPRPNGREASNENLAIRNGALPDLSDIYLLPQVKPEYQELLVRNSTLLGRGIFNPMNSPQELLYALAPKSVVQQIVQLRKENRLSAKTFSGLTGINEGESVLLYPSNMLSIELQARVNESLARKRILFELVPHADEHQTPIIKYAISD